MPSPIQLPKLQMEFFSAPPPLERLKFWRYTYIRTSTPFFGYVLIDCPTKRTKSIQFDGFTHRLALEALQSQVGGHHPEKMSHVFVLQEAEGVGGVDDESLHVLQLKRSSPVGVLVHGRTR